MDERDDGLDRVELFRDLEPRVRRHLAARLETLTLDRGALLVHQGDVADALYIIIAGRFSVSVTGRPEPIAELGAGHVVGEIAFLTGGVRTASVIALRQSLVLRLDRREFDDLSEISTGLWRTLTIALARRLGDTNRPATPDARPAPRTIALIPAGGSPIPPDFLAAFVARLGRVARVSVMGRAAAVGALSHVAPVLAPPADPESADAIRNLNALEDAADFMIFVADPDLSSWSRQAIRQSDLVLAVGHFAATSEPNALEAYASGVIKFSNQRLVLLHAKRAPIAGAARWLAARPVAMHHHVALDQPADIARLCRFVRGVAVGLVACGGGAYCAAHIGVYQALIECGVAVDIVGGTSGGAAMAAAFAMGTSPDRIDQAVHDVFVTNSAMSRYTWPRYSLLDHAHYDAQLATHYGGVDIEDLWTPYFAVSTNLSRHALHVHKRGSVWESVRASGSIPVLLPPFYDAEGHMLVDGALLDNVPISAMHALKTGPNVVVSFKSPKLERFDVDYANLPGRRQLLTRLFDPRQRGRLPLAPGIADVLMRSMMANRQDFERHLRAGDVHMQPPLPPGMTILEWRRHSEAMALAYAWTKMELARLDEPARHSLCTVD